VTKREKLLEIMGLAHQEEEKTKKKDMEEEKMKQKDMEEEKTKKKDREEEMKEKNKNEEVKLHHLKIPLLGQ
jgi:hypothetical protein